jgi:hypothetical protein
MSPIWTGSAPQLSLHGALVSFWLCNGVCVYCFRIDRLGRMLTFFWPAVVGRFQIMERRKCHRLSRNDPIPPGRLLRLGTLCWTGKGHAPAFTIQEPNSRRSLLDHGLRLRGDDVTHLLRLREHASALQVSLDRYW